jgi:hypothetical protein
MLKPERARSLEAGLESVDTNPWRVAAFEHRYRDLIDFDPILPFDRAQLIQRFNWCCDKTALRPGDRHGASRPNFCQCALDLDLA